MQKQLIQQISKAMQANADTIARQKDVIDYQEQSIERLKRLLTALAETQDQELKALPTTFAALETSLQENTKEQKVWRQSCEAYTERQATLAAQLMSLTNVQLKLTTALDQYQSILVQVDESAIDMNGLETMLKSTSEQLETSQSIIKQSQEKISSELERLGKLLQP